MKNLTTNQLVTINLRYGSSAKPLKILAFAQLSAKALFLSSKLSSLSQLTSKITNLIGVKKISEDFVKEGLDYLKEIKKVNNKNERWVLTEEARSEIENDVSLSQKILGGVLDRHFPATIEKTRLKDWFNEAAASFFGYYSEEWVNSVCKGVKRRFIKPKTIEELLRATIEKNQLVSEKKHLLDGFTNFLSSSNVADQQYLMSLGQAMFSARLVTADIGVDPLTLEELRESKLILDTNVLFAISLENHRVAKAFKTLGEALRIIKSQPIYFHETKEEYGRALTGKRGEILHLVDVFSREVIKGTRDDFITTAKARRCVSKEDYERFFDSLKELPGFVSSGPKIQIEDYEEMERIKQKAEKDNRLKQEIQNFCLRLRPSWRKERVN